MKINQIKFKNFLSYGNKMQSIDLTQPNGLHLIRGQNGAGKCLHGKTKIYVDMTEEMWKQLEQIRNQNLK